MNSKLVFVYFPSWWEYSCKNHVADIKVLAPLFHNNGIKLVDARTPLKSFKVEEIFPLSGGSHYTKEANLAIGRYLRDRLAK